MKALQLKDPLGNTISFDVDSIGVAILNPQASTMAHEKIREGIQNPTVILELETNKRAYILISTFFSYLEVEYTNNSWYVNDLDIEKKPSELAGIMKRYNVLYICEKAQNEINKIKK